MLFRTVVAVLCCAPLGAQTFEPYPLLKITEISIDPHGPNAGAQIVEIEAIVNRNVDTTGYQLAIDGSLSAFPSVVIPHGRRLLLFIGASGTSTTGIFFPTAPPLGLQQGVIAIFASTNTQDPNELIDYVSWGGGVGHMATAVQAGRWSSVFDSLPSPGAEGSTFAHREWALASGRGPEAWYVDTTPTLGLPNDPAMTFHYLTACTPQSPQFGIYYNSVSDPGPWLGETYEMIIAYWPQATSSLYLAIGWNAIPPVSLAPIGVPECSIGTTFDIVMPVGTSTGLRTFSYSISTDPVFLGISYYQQAIATGLTGVNALGLIVSHVTLNIVGSR